MQEEKTFREIQLSRMALDDYKMVMYRNQPSGWVAHVPAISGCYALMPTRAEALAELERVLGVIEAEYRDKGQAIPSATRPPLQDVSAPRRR
jgi:predicted RNase H-like HicB family nuclease